MRRKTPLVTGETYHVYTKSIYGYVIFPTEREYNRMMALIKYYRLPQKGPRFSLFIASYSCKKEGFEKALNLLHPGGDGGLVEILAFCIMPTHLHFILKQVAEHGIYTFMSRILNGYSLYFNTLHNRKGPLWQERFGASLIRTDEKLAEKIAYVHNNPVKDLGVARPEDWPYSSITPGVMEVMDRFRQSGGRP